MKYPNIVRIFTGTNDPLRDDNLRILLRLINNNINTKMHEFNYFPHGFLNYDVPNIMPEASISSNIIIKEIVELIQTSNVKT